MTLRRISAGLLLALVAALAFGGARAHGTHPGANGVIAFEGDIPGPSQTIYTVNADGTGLTSLLPTDDKEWFNAHGSSLMNPTFSPDGSRIAFDAQVIGNAPSTTCDPQNELVFSVTPTGTIAGLVCQFEWTEQISWSPDGSALVLDKFRDSESDLFLVDLTTGQDSVLYRRLNDACNWESPSFAAWSPLGDKIVFAMGYEYHCPTLVSGGGLFTIEPDGTNLTQLTVESFVSTPGLPDWSPDATKIVYLKPKTPTGTGHVAFGDIYVLDVASGLSTLLTSVGRNHRPVWSPDGTRIAFASNRDGDYDIYTMRPDGTDVQQVTNLAGDEFSPSWQPLAAPPDPDADDDGVDDSIQTAPGSFDDGSGTSGSLVDAAGLAVLVSDADDPGDGVQITVGPGTGKATFTICGFTVKVSAGSTVVVTCGSATVEVVEGEAEIELGGGTVVVSVPEAGIARVTDEGGTFFGVENLGQTDVTVTVDGVDSTVASGETTSVSTDVTGPVVTCEPASFVLNQPGAIVGATVSDAESGPAASTVSTPVATSAPGAQSVEVTGFDQAGNGSTVTCTYSVSYAFAGFFQPIDNLPTVNSAKAGQTIPVKWRLTDFHGTPVTDSTSFISVTSGSQTCDASDPQDAIETYAGNSGLQYLGNGNWQFNWKTPKSYAGECRVMRLNLADGATDRRAVFRFK